MVRVSVTDVDLIVEEAKTNSLGYWRNTTRERQIPMANESQRTSKEREREKRDWRWGSERG